MSAYGDTAMQCRGQCNGNHAALTQLVQGGVLAAAGVGLYDLTLDQGCNDSEMAASLTLKAPGQANIVSTSDTVKRISTFAVDGTTATDKAFCITIDRIITA